ncbi:glycosyltransferase [Pararoseomonas indoligenes]|uniref:Glycosyltransferase n=1 Tax=Roseomonas indoligenes TaxID=2820811 RepID=A0A940N2D5_9PROT|nr:glycosyltransferase [Pararoseomonas indoligenes]MBP0495309.1 glycosyltransferase [Pararoseomonas indoligenes]
MTQRPRPDPWNTLPEPIPARNEADLRGRAAGGRDPAPVIAVIVSHDRPALLRRCLTALAAQRRPPDATLVIDNASPPSTAAVVADFPAVRHIRLPRNLGGAGGFRAGIGKAMAAGAGAIWLMDDDGLPASPDCLAGLLAAAEGKGGIVAPLILDIERPDRLAFPVRIAGRTRFHLAELEGRAQVAGFAHLFNGALIARETFERIGLPEPRYVIRGDEVEFLRRALRAGLEVRIETACRFLHPSSHGEIEPILFGRFYATVPATEAKRYYQFRNRGQIFRAYGLWGYLLADIVRYGWFYLVTRRADLRGFASWLGTTAKGWHGGFLRAPWNDAEGPPPYPTPATGMAGAARMALPLLMRGATRPRP